MYNPSVVRPKKPSGETATERIDLRVTVAEREEYERAAGRSDQTLSSWIKERLSRAAKRELKR